MIFAVAFYCFDTFTDENCLATRIVEADSIEKAAEIATRYFNGLHPLSRYRLRNLAINDTRILE